jgi:transcriptional regulator with XRE-family HTH domain
LCECVDISYARGQAGGIEEEENESMLVLRMPIKDRLKELRTAAGLTQQDLAFKAGLSVTAIVHIEGGRIKDPRMSTLRAIAQALNVAIDELAGSEDEQPKKKRRKRPE